MLNRIKKYHFKKLDFLILVATSMLGLIGSFTLKIMPGVSDSLSHKQIIGIFLGIFTALFVALFDYRFVCKFYIPMYIFNFVLLILVKYTRFGIVQYGAKRWLGIKDVFSFQPSELTKVILVIFVAKMFDMMKDRLKKFSTFLFIGILTAVPVYLVLIQTDLSTSIVLFVCFCIIVIASGYSWKILLFIVAVFVPIVKLLFWYIQQPGQVLLSTKQQGRVLSFLNPEAYPDLIYQQNNALKAIKSGGLFGKYFTDSTAQRGSTFVPVRATDFIYTGICEEFGFIGALVVIALITFIVIRMMLIAKKTSDVLAKMIISGVASIIMVQSFINIGVVSSILPNTGIPLPFVSTGLSSVLSNYIMVGLVLNISINDVTYNNKRGGSFDEYWPDSP